MNQELKADVSAAGLDQLSSPVRSGPDARAFPTLDEQEMDVFRQIGKNQRFEDGQFIFKAGDADIDFYIVESGQLDILNPTDGNSLIVSHKAGAFVGDIDLLTRRPVIVTAQAHGVTEVIRVPGAKLRMLLNTVPRLSDKLLIAFQVRRQKLNETGKLGLKIVGPGHCGDTQVVREFLYKNFVPFMWLDTNSEAGKTAQQALNRGTKTPLIQTSNGNVMVNPTLRQLAREVGVLPDCPTQEFDLAIIGAGPAGMAAAVYAASEGLKTIVLDRLGPGGQAAGSSKIENFIGFPAGLSGADLATRAVLQMMKFGATLLAPISVEELIPAQQDDQPHQLRMDCGSILKAYVVLVTTGVTWRRLAVPGAEKFERAGVYYACTSVEVRTHEKTEVAVVGAGNSAGQAAMFLAENCAKHVHMLVRRADLSQGMSSYLANRILSTPNITVHFSTEVAEVHGKGRLDCIDVINKETKEKCRLNVSAVFVFIGAEPHGGWLPASVARDELGYLMTGTDVIKSGQWPLTHREPCALETTIPRVLAGGDVRAGSTKRVGFAVGDGSYAVTCVHRLRTLRV
jgi:thioredoxin reductase (NADPH)